MSRPALVLAVLLALAPVPAYASNRADYPHQGEVVGYTDPDTLVGNHAAHRPRVLVIGDSIVYRIWKNGGGYRRHPSWEVTAVPGRDVCNLPWYLRDRLANPSPLRMVIVAVGTNACAGWDYGDYRAAANLLPRKTRLMFVTTYRDPEHSSRASGDPYRAQAWVQSWYSKWVVEIAGLRNRTCIAQWRSFAEKWGARALPDGVHVSTKFGYDGWFRLVEARLGKRCV